MKNVNLRADEHLIESARDRARREQTMNSGAGWRAMLVNSKKLNSPMQLCTNYGARSALAIN